MGCETEDGDHNCSPTPGWTLDMFVLIALPHASMLEYNVAQKFKLFVSLVNAKMKMTRKLRISNELMKGSHVSLF